MFYRLATVAWMGVITLLSHQPAESDVIGLLPPEITNLMHIPVYALLALLAWLDIRGGDRRTASAVIGTLVFVLLFALFDEWHQSFVPGRDTSIGDIFNDMLGASIALWAAVYFRVRAAEPRPARIT
ncbi:hypothetical protein BOW51_06655 [Solemya velesiana gill symbiont]|uniref:VanZ-like domain-containing protein n=2 Tax=Solemya velesiana gill symbiont TaxID=1918948 RepID=A0A1T2KUN0_9GAMM|nr:hypothetical protein BOW51_06655 [Solemya velesiana gill symbiont]